MNSKLVMWADSGEGPEILNGAKLVDVENWDALNEALGVLNLDESELDYELGKEEALSPEVASEIRAEYYLDKYQENAGRFIIQTSNSEDGEEVQFTATFFGNVDDDRASIYNRWLQCGVYYNTTSERIVECDSVPGEVVQVLDRHGTYVTPRQFDQFCIGNFHISGNATVCGRSEE